MPLMDMVRAPLRKVGQWAARSLANWTLSGLTPEQARALGWRPSTLSGVRVTDQTALESVEYFAGVRNVSEDLATLPVMVFRREGERNRVRDYGHSLFDILHYQFNEEMDSVQAIEMMQAWLMIRRNCYAEVQRTTSGKIVGLWPMPSSRVEVHRFEGELFYKVNLPNGERDAKTGQPYSVLPRSQMLHVKAFTLDGVLGEAATVMHEEAIGLALALDQYGAEFFGNDATPGGVYTTAGTLNDQSYERMKKELNDPNTGVGLGNKHRTMLLEQGTTFNPITTPNDKAQFIDSKRYSTEQMARLNRTPPHKIGDLSRSTFSNIEHQGIDYVVSSIRPYAVRWERAIQVQLMTKQERATHYVEFMLDALLRGDSMTRAETLAIWRQNGIVNADEWREYENLNEIADGSGKKYLVNGNMIPIEQASRLSADASSAKGTAARADIDASRVFRPLFRAAAEGCLRKESAAVGKAIEREFRAKGMKAFEGWMIDFYREQETTIRRTFVPLAVSVGEALRGATGPDLGEWAEEYSLSVAAARRRLATESVRAVVSSGSSDMTGALVALAAGWSREEEITRMADQESAAMQESLKRHLARNPGLAA